MGKKPKADQTMIQLQKKQLNMAKKQKTLEEMKMKSRQVAILHAQQARDMGFARAKPQIASAIQNNPAGMIL